MLQKIKNHVFQAAVFAPILAQETINLKPKDETSFSNLTKLTAGGIVSGAISLIMIVVALIFFFILVLGGLKWITSGGDEKAVGVARSQITNALIGLAIVFASWAIIKLIETVFGISILKEGITIPSFQSAG